MRCLSEAVAQVNTKVDAIDEIQSGAVCDPRSHKLPKSRLVEYKPPLSRGTTRVLLQEYNIHQLCHPDLSVDVSDITYHEHLKAAPSIGINVIA